jgi:hypothetical protein
MVFIVPKLKISDDLEHYHKHLTEMTEHLEAQYPWLSKVISRNDLSVHELELHRDYYDLMDERFFIGLLQEFHKMLTDKNLYQNTQLIDAIKKIILDLDIKDKEKEEFIENYPSLRGLVFIAQYLNESVFSRKDLSEENQHQAILLFQQAMKLNQAINDSENIESLWNEAINNPLAAAYNDITDELLTTVIMLRFSEAKTADEKNEVITKLKKAFEGLKIHERSSETHINFLVQHLAPHLKSATTFYPFDEERSRLWRRSLTGIVEDLILLSRSQMTREDFFEQLKKTSILKTVLAVTTFVGIAALFFIPGLQPIALLIASGFIAGAFTYSLTPLVFNMVFGMMLIGSKEQYEHAKKNAFFRVFMANFIVALTLFSTFSLSTVFLTMGLSLGFGVGLSAAVAFVASSMIKIAIQSFALSLTGLGATLGLPAVKLLMMSIADRSRIHSDLSKMSFSERHYWEQQLEETSLTRRVSNFFVSLISPLVSFFKSIPSTTPSRSIKPRASKPFGNLTRFWYFNFVKPTRALRDQLNISHNMRQNPKEPLVSVLSDEQLREKFFNEQVIPRVVKESFVTFYQFFSGKDPQLMQAKKQHLLNIKKEFYSEDEQSFNHDVTVIPMMLKPGFFSQRISPHFEGNTPVLTKDAHTDGYLLIQHKDKSYLLTAHVYDWLTNNKDMSQQAFDRMLKKEAFYLIEQMSRNTYGKKEYLVPVNEDFIKKLKEKGYEERLSFSKADINDTHLTVESSETETQSSEKNPIMIETYSNHDELSFSEENTHRSELKTKDVSAFLEFTSRPKKELTSKISKSSYRDSTRS